MNRFVKLLSVLLVLILLTGCGINSQCTVPEPTEGPALSGDAPFQVHFIDVGQADAALVISNGHAMLIDGGNREDSNVIYSYLKKLNITYLDYIICSHAHEDHVGGLPGALNFADVGVAFCPVTEYDTSAFRNFKKALSDKGVGITVPSHGQTFDLGDAQCQIVGPIRPSDDPNNTSIVLKITYNEVSFLFTGDAEIDEERDILNAGYDISCDVLKVGHHGSSTSTSYLWLRSAAPTYGVISVGKDNDYGHPHEEPMSRLRDADVTLYRTDKHGDIIFYSDGIHLEIQTVKGKAPDSYEDAGEGSNQKTAYVLNTNSRKFHLPSCSSAADISSQNRQDVTCTRQELIDQGYDPCGRCDP